MAVNGPLTLCEHLLACLRHKCDNPSELFDSTSKRSKPETEFSVEQFEQLIPSPVCVNVKNSDGLIPFEVALLNFEQIGWNNLVDLKSLLPSQEIASTINCDLVLDQVLKSDMYADEIMEFISMLSDSGFECSLNKVWSVALAADTCLIDIISRLMVINGVEPSLEDFKQVFVKYESLPYGKGYAYGNLIIRMLVVMPGDTIKKLDGDLPGLFQAAMGMVYSDGREVAEGAQVVIERGYKLDMYHYYLLARNCTTNEYQSYIKWVDAENFPKPYLLNLPPEIIAQLNGEDRNFFNIATDNDGSAELYELLVAVGLKITAENVEYAFDSEKKLRWFLETIHSVLDAAQGGVEGQLNDILDDPIGTIFDKFNDCFEKINFCDECGCDFFQDEYKELATSIMGLLIENGYRPTFKDLKTSLRFNIIGIAPFECLLWGLDQQSVNQLSTVIPDILNRMLNSYLHIRRVEMYCRHFDIFCEVEHSESLVELVNTLLNECNIDVNYSNEKYGFVLHNIVNVSCRKIECGSYAFKLLSRIIERPELNINKTVNRTVDENVIEERAIDLAISYGRFQVVNMLICAGADCDGLNFRVARGKPGSLNMFKLLYKLGQVVETYQDDELSDWIRSQPIPSLLELSVLAIRRSTTRTGLDDLICELKEDDCGFPETVLEYLELKHLNYLIA